MMIMEVYHRRLWWWYDQEIRHTRQDIGTRTSKPFCFCSLPLLPVRPMSPPCPRGTSAFRESIDCRGTFRRADTCHATRKHT
jgi:hypothetical protein